MNPIVLDKRVAAPPSNQQRENPAGTHGPTAVKGRQGLSRFGPDGESTKDRRKRSEALAHSLAGAADLGELVAIINEQGRPAAARAAAVRPDLVPLINGEFPHIALSLADLD